MTNYYDPTLPRRAVAQFCFTMFAIGSILIFLIAILESLADHSPPPYLRGTSMADAEFKPIHPFDIDHGELGDLSQQECFTLGYELAMVDALFQIGGHFERPIHAQNAERIRRQAERLGREIDLKWIQDDSSETWMWLTVPAKAIE